MLYFTSGSNLFTMRLTGRVPSIKLITTGKPRQQKLVFHKAGMDLGLLTPVLAIFLNWVWGATTALTIKIANSR